ncbi:stage II sporulation protein E (SpoIIE) [Agathobacter rectalis CAG:36]|uniref:Stage II sporulation protein E (SpoIIE) n=1 Tax=Agathobacter rectalis CAG:36 TaxID=1263079 RepID=R6TIB5_9FIRM|nr:stage II sporulation protein E (SpoIIE) [Agathobacter rectalis CAG:36]
MRSANLKKAVWGLMAFASTLVCVMDCYPLIPAVYGVYCLSSGHTIIFYIGLIIGMGYFISIPSICKYLFIIAVIYFGERLFVRKSSKNGCLTTAVVAKQKKRMSDTSRCSSLCHGGDESVGNISGKAGYG